MAQQALSTDKEAPSGLTQRKITRPMPQRSHATSSLRGAERRSNPSYRTGLLRCARF